MIPLRHPGHESTDIALRTYLKVLRPRIVNWNDTVQFREDGLLNSNQVTSTDELCALAICGDLLGSTAAPSTTEKVQYN